MSETTESIYDRSADSWRRSEPILLSDFTARPFLVDWCEPIAKLNVLDLGCGEGYVSRKLVERGAGSVHGIDVSAEMIKRAEAQELEAGGSRIEFRAGDAKDLSHLGDDSFDLVTAVFLFNYLDREATAKTMAEVGRVLRPGGRFIFAVPHPSLAFLRAEERPFYFSRGEHGYISGRDVQFEGKIWRRDGEAVQVRCVHKTLDDYFMALKAAGFKSLPDLKELHATDEHIAFDPEFFEPLRDQPLHLAFRLRWGG